MSTAHGNIGNANAKKPAAKRTSTVRANCNMTAALHRRVAAAAKRQKLSVSAWLAAAAVAALRKKP